MRAAGVGVMTLIACAGLCGQEMGFRASRNSPAIAYDSTAPRNTVSELNSRIASGAVRLEFAPVSGYLDAVLAALQIPRESQGLVFSETSAQFERINPTNPRAVYFSDTASVGWVRGTDTLEVAALDPRLGYVFYTLAQKAQARPRFERQVSCLECHQTSDTLGVPGPFVYSTFQMSDDPNAYASGIPVDHRTPIADRWGGWYVTGRPGAAQHRGNVPVIVKASELLRPRGPTPRLDSVAGAFDTRGYPSTCSDVVSRLVLEHQARMTNFITWIGWEARIPTGDVRGVARNFVDYLLFVDEAPLASPVAGSCGFAERFVAQGPRDRNGRSLREFDLQHRLMRYPCSYMINSAAFDALPPGARQAVYERLWQVLSGGDRASRYARLTATDRNAVVEILRDTKTDLPAYFHVPAP